MKKIILLLCAVCLVISFAGCGETKNDDTNPPVNQEEPKVEIGIEDGGEIGDVSEEPEEIEIEEADGEPVKKGNEIVGQISLERGEDGNITKEAAVAVLYFHSAEELGLSADVEYQMYFDPETVEIEGKKCYAIAAKKPGEGTEGVFYVALDGSASYKYDSKSGKHIKLS